MHAVLAPIPNNQYADVEFHLNSGETRSDITVVMLQYDPFDLVSF